MNTSAVDGSSMLDRFWPITTGCQLARAPKGAVADRIHTFLVQNRLPERSVQQSRYRIDNNVAESLDGVFQYLLPLARQFATRTAVVGSSKQEWSVIFSNRARGRSDIGLCAYLSDSLSTCVIGANHQPDSIRRIAGRETGIAGGTNLMVYKNGQRERLITCVHAETWSFAEEGQPYSWEHTDRYKAPKVAARFTGEMLHEYLHHLGVAPFTDDFYCVTAENPAMGLTFETEDHTVDVTYVTPEEFRRDFD